MRINWKKLAPESKKKQSVLSQKIDAGPRAPLTLKEFVSTVCPQYKWYKHHDKLAAVLQRVADKEIDRLMVWMPPRHGKTYLITQLFSAYWLYRYPDQTVAICGNSQRFVNKLSRSVRDFYQASGCKVRHDASATQAWETPEGGGLWGAGPTGQGMGYGFSLGIVDDVLKAQDAPSVTYRAKIRRWYEETFYSRQHFDGAAIICVQQRLHEDDLAGYLLAAESDIDDEDGEALHEGWHVINYEALKEEESVVVPSSCTLEPDWRKPGQSLWPEKFPPSRLKKIRNKNPHSFESLYQQRPTARAGEFFKPEWFEIVPAVPGDKGDIVRGWDLAATEGRGDFTTGVKIKRIGDLFYVLDVVRGQWSSGQRDKMIKQTAELDGLDTLHLFEQEGGSGGKDQILAIVTMLKAYRAGRFPNKGRNKVLRADQLASQSEVGNIKLVRGAWNRDFIEELRKFGPKAKHDDQVDAASIAFNYLSVL